MHNPGLFGSLNVRWPQILSNPHYPHLFEPLKVGAAHAAEPHPDGIDAHRPRERAWRARQTCRVLCRARRRRHRAHRHRCLRAEHGRQPQPGARNDARRRRSRRPSRHSAGGARCGRSHPAAAPARGALQQAPERGRAFGAARADQQGHAARAGDGGSRAHHRGFRARRDARARGRLRRRRDHGLGGLPDHAVPLPAHQPAHRRMGRPARAAHALRHRDRAPHARTLRRRLPHPVPPFGARPGRRRPERRGDHQRRTRRRSGGRRPPQLGRSAGTKRASRRSRMPCRAAPSPGRRGA